MPRRAGHVRFAIAVVNEVSGEVARRRLFAYEYFFRRGKDVGSVAEDLAAEPLVNQMAEMNPIIGINTRSDQKNAQSGR